VTGREVLITLIEQLLIDPKLIVRGIEARR
jgi:hypothetical protein